MGASVDIVKNVPRDPVLAREQDGFHRIAACECHPNLNANIVMIRQYRQVEPIELVMITGESVLPAC